MKEQNQIIIIIHIPCILLIFLKSRFRNFNVKKIIILILNLNRIFHIKKKYRYYDTILLLLGVGCSYYFPKRKPKKKRSRRTCLLRTNDKK